VGAVHDQHALGAGTLLLDRYRVEEMLGEGGLGTVYRAYDTRLKRLVAIKTLKRGSFASDPDQFRALEERFAREAEAGSRMGSHPNLVGVHDLIIDADRTQYLILEYVPGGTLGERIAQGPILFTDTLHLAIDIAHALQAAHEMGLVHRDIKPANIFLSSAGRAKVGDFGIAQIDDISGRTRSSSGHPGTPLYMSPEQERLTAYLRPASDQYSLGLVLFEMLTGQTYIRSAARQAAAHLAEQPTS
jgi:serine/threonine protein kinase